ncbi:MAG TPA: alcohol dehydrogenase catalytic domain-containing protein [Acidothermaceae bacterium]
MHALTYIGPGQIEVSDVTDVEPAPGEVQVEVAFTGICGTDLHIFHGDMDARVTTPAIIGHEMSGRVAAIGSDVTGWSVGDRVTVMPLDWCGSCPACLAGHSHVCHKLKFIGIDAPGSLQRLWNVPARTLVRLPESLSLQHAALVEPTAVAVHDVRRAGLLAGERALVVGGGPVGFLIAIVAHAVGAEVLVVEPNALRRSLAESVGLRTIDPHAADVVATVSHWTDGAGAEVAFEVSGVGAGVTTAVDALGVRGRLLQVAIHGQPREVNLHRFFWRELTLLGARLYEPEDFERAIELLNDGVVPADTLVSAVEPLSNGAEAFRVLGAGTAMKVLVDCRA